MIHIINKKAVLTSLVMLGAVVIAAMPASAQVAFSATSFAQLVRTEGLTETVGAVTLTATAAGTISTNPGSSIIFTYGAPISGPCPSSTLANCSSAANGGGYVTTAGAGSTPPTSTAVSGNQVSLIFQAPAGSPAGTTIAVPAGTTYTVSQVRLNINSLGSAATQVFATLSGTAPATAQITFTQSQVQVAQIVPAALKSVGGTPAAAIQTCAIPAPAAAGNFTVKATENYPAALTSASDETNFTPNFPAPTSGTNVVVTISGVPSGMAVAYVSATGAPTFLATTSSVRQTSTGSGTLQWVIPVSGNITGTARSFTFNFQIGLPGSGSTAVVGGTLNPIGATATPTAVVSLSPVGTSATSVITFAANTQGSPVPIATIGDCVTNILFPYVTNATGSGFDTSFAISNTTADYAAFGSGIGATPQTGACVLTLFPTATGGTAATAVQGTTPAIPAGAVYTFSISSAFGGALSGQTGYVIAVCRFLNGHGFAFLTSGYAQATAKQISHGYLGLVLPNPVATRNGTPAGNGEILFH